MKHLILPWVLFMFFHFIQVPQTIEENQTLERIDIENYNEKDKNNAVII
ncbi:MAG: hypothetical protein OEZ34_04680 [Spirochaetia bacterium]|nr:hypothetical protein [Spirochaetia bacterium]